MSAARTMSLFRGVAMPSSARAVRTFHSCKALSVGKESEVHNENRAEEAEAAKQQQLKAQKEGKGEWKDTLASDSESIVKADRGEVKADKSTIEALQKESAKAAQQERK
ncbi:uncharacterized protein K489DRAFT_381755 [Dissoconium aciculare CBS 342.82]|uniref:Mitochondrial carrier n=1 Tax=Dissoconium aciculare CBS 342.82 TaxID=1314786 RepID=A0A6J3M1J6_9PEZI|nr:uncharacterized protein K489DRAFT_381755 [Dissoconium aciculare CBS 342.82]KAF1821763.1 hypothetical protein K489DRAFT_381755 [Dissoconium aciculare CBS 342.82]